MDTLPTELLILVFQNCHNLGETFSLALSCKSLYRVWQQSRSLWGPKLARSQCLALNEAVKTAHLITERFHAQVGIPSAVAFSSRHTDDDVKRLSWHEIIHALYMNRVASVVENTLCPTEDDMEYMYETKPIDTLIRRAQVYRKLQRLLSVDPVVSGEYIQLCIKIRQPIIFDDAMIDVSRSLARNKNNCYTAGSGNLKLDAQRIVIYRQTLDLLGRCLLNTRVAKPFRSSNVLGIDPSPPRNRVEAIASLKVVFSS